LPRTDLHAKLNLQRHSGVKAVKEKSMSGSACIRTLIIDDESLARERIRDMLASQPQIEIIADCANGQEAIEAIQLHSPDLVFLERLVIKMNGHVFFIKAEEIDWLEAEGNYVRLHAGKESYLLRDTISALELQLDPKRFIRVHRSAIVNIDRITELQPWFHGEYRIILREGVQLTLSRTYREKLHELLGRPL